MKFQANTFLKAMEGSWISQKTIFYLKTNQICCNQFNYTIKKNHFLRNDSNINNLNCLEFYNINKKQKDYYNFIQTNQDNLGYITKNYNQNIDSYKYSIYKHNCLKIEYKTSKVEYIEYIYVINQTFMTNISLLKKSDKYMAISFASNIKLPVLDK
uniref:chromophore lyase CpcS/CpeS-like protein n=1 Tax=Pachymeniopsis lanceolata TaxID=151733 RepID=UPI002A832600|nr:chromophore lyase CpcS/CpeS-like protein [Pachymeniopsis lanceolata]WOL37325.1 chromophore lyase CpcS/CpeS-like protein [Pachymeniopsis lanceolata]